MSRSAILYRIISPNKDTEIGKKLNLSSIKTIEDYRDNVPLTDYEDYRPYIERMIEKGEENLLSPDKVTFYCPTSGITTKSKLFPKFIPPGSHAPPHFNQALMLCSFHQDKNIPLGVPIIPGLNAQTQAFLDRSESSFVAPRGAYQITDFMSAIYVQMVAIWVENLFCQVYSGWILFHCSDCFQSPHREPEDRIGRGTWRRRPSKSRSTHCNHIREHEVWFQFLTQLLISYGPILPALLPLPVVPLQLTSPSLSTI